MTHSRKQIAALLDEHGIRPSRALGQNYVADANTVRRIARLADVHEGDWVVEIGAGLGSLTLALVETGARVTAIELDRYVFPVLAEVLADTNVEMVEADATTIDWSTIVPPDKRAVAVGNLPYNVGTAIITRVLRRAPQFQRIVVLVQREVADRLVAGPGTKAYGALSVVVRYFAVAKILGVVPPTVFVPQPEVDSALIEITRTARPSSVADPEVLFELVHAGFAHRRKMLRRALVDRADIDAFERAGISPTARAEELDVADWIRLLDEVSHG